jgi:hypothetical protein
MDVLDARGGGRDIHHKTGAAGLSTSPEGPEPVKAIRTFRTMTAARLAWADWLQEAGGTPYRCRVFSCCFGQP